VALSPDGLRAVSLGEQTKLWDISNLTTEFTNTKYCVLPPNKLINTVLVGPDSRTLLVTTKPPSPFSKEGYVVLYDVLAKTNITTIDFQQKIGRACISPDCSMFGVSLGSGGLLNIYDLKTKALIWEQTMDSHAFAFVPGTDLIARYNNFQNPIVWTFWNPRKHEKVSEVSYSDVFNWEFLTSALIAIRTKDDKARTKVIDMTAPYHQQIVAVLHTMGRISVKDHLLYCFHENNLKIWDISKSFALVRDRAWPANYWLIVDIINEDLVIVSTGNDIGVQIFDLDKPSHQCILYINLSFIVQHVVVSQKSIYCFDNNGNMEILKLCI